MDLLLEVADLSVLTIAGLVAGFLVAGYFTGRLLAASGAALLAGAILALLTLLVGIALLLPALILAAVATYVFGYIHGTALRRPIASPIGVQHRTNQAGSAQSRRSRATVSVI